MKTKTCLVILSMLLFATLASAAYTSPGWSYGFELGVARGDNAGSAENFGPLVGGHVQLDVFPFLFVRVGAGYTQLHASKTYKTETIKTDYRVLFEPFVKANVSPFIYLGAGASKELRDADADVIPLVPVGIGVHTAIKEGLKLEVSTGYNLANSDILDGRARANDDMNRFTDKKQDGFFNLSVGLSFSSVPKKPDPKPVVPVVVKPTPPPAPKPVPVPTPEPVKPAPVPTVDPATIDTDGDGLTDMDEINKYNTDPKLADTDGEGLNDFAEVMKYKSNPLNPDTDGEGLNDYAEVMQHKTNPLNPDTDGEGLNDYAEVMQHKTNPLNPDTDGEGLNDYVEVMQYKTNPLNPDTDGEGLNDYAEVMEHKTNPLNPDTDGEGLTDFAEVSQYKTDPLVVDTDKGSVDDATEVKENKNPLDPKDDVLNLTEGVSLTLEGVLFETGKATLLPVSIQILEKAYTALSANPDVKVMIVGHTDNVGTDASNQSLSERRAAAVKTWLVNKGIKADRLRTMGKGETEPRATNDTPAGRTLNRRIEFQIEK